MKNSSTIPAVFIGHGTPMNALERNRYTDAWTSLAASMPTPRAILAISAHWYIRGTAVTSNERQKTIHDFYGFPPELFAMDYSAPGDPALANRIVDVAKPTSVTLDESWGIDHGTWSVLAHMFPKKEIPVLQLSIDGTKPPDFHYELGKRLATLRDEGVLLLGSGNVVHNLGALQRSTTAPPYDWATQFDEYVRKAVESGDHDALIHPERAGQAARLSIPSAEHYLPLLYIMGAQRKDEKPSIVCDGIDLASISMLTVRIG